MKNNDKVVKFSKELAISKPEMDFFQFERAIVNKFEDDADGFDIQELYVTYYQ